MNRELRTLSEFWTPSPKEPTPWLAIVLSVVWLLLVAAAVFLGCTPPLSPEGEDCHGACNRYRELVARDHCADSTKSPAGAECEQWHCGKFFTAARASCESHAATCSTFDACKEAK